jgi:EAL domain-containing protein (putative c-di-GMP-specific phosphodiesterase class I)
VLDEACRQLADWTDTNGCDEQFTMAVNVSGIQLRDPRLPDRLATVLKRHRITPGRLCLEITENALIGADLAIASLSALGVRLALDNFGTGYSTLARFKDLRAHILKIDRTFLREVSREPRDREIITAITTMAHALGMTVVGEGIETATERTQLAAVDCDSGQGCLFTAPLPPEAVARLNRSAETTPEGSYRRRWGWQDGRSPRTHRPSHPNPMTQRPRTPAPLPAPISLRTFP